MRNKKFVLDTSIIIDGEITKMLEAGSIEEESDIIIPLAVLDELQSQASNNKEDERDLYYKKHQPPFCGSAA